MVDETSRAEIVSEIFEVELPEALPCSSLPISAIDGYAYSYDELESIDGKVVKFKRKH